MQRLSALPCVTVLCRLARGLGRLKWVLLHAQARGTLCIHGRGEIIQHRLALHRERGTGSAPAPRLWRQGVAAAILALSLMSALMSVGIPCAPHSLNAHLTTCVWRPLRALSVPAHRPLRTDHPTHALQCHVCAPEQCARPTLLGAARCCSMLHELNAAQRCMGTAPLDAAQSQTCPMLLSAVCAQCRPVPLNAARARCRPMLHITECCLVPLNAARARCRPMLHITECCLVPLNAARARCRPMP